MQKGDCINTIQCSVLRREVKYLRLFSLLLIQVTNLRKAIVKSNEASEKEKAAAAAAREKAEKEEERKRLAEEEEARVAKEKKEAAALAEAMQDAKDGGLGDNADGVAGEISQDNDGSGASVGAGSANAEGVGDDGSVGSGIGVQDEHLAHRLALTVNKSKAKTQTTLLVSGSRMLRHCLAAVPVVRCY
jgi:membrane protein involved in colicin uptake